MLSIKTILKRHINEKLYNKIKLFFNLLEDSGEDTRLYFVDYNDKGEYLNFQPFNLPMMSMPLYADESFISIVTKADFILGRINYYRNLRGKNEKT